MSRAQIDSVAWIKGREGKSLRFNALIYDSPEGEPWVVKAFRIQDGYILLPAHVQGRFSYPVLYLPKVKGEALVDEVLSSQLLRQCFPEIFPLLSREDLVNALLFESKYKLRDFPNILMK